MKVKDIERTANVAWSPKTHHPIYLAAGTAASQLDASFSTNAALEIYALNLTEPGPDTQLISSKPSDHRFHKLIWGPAGSDSAGTIIGGCDDGLLQIYSASKLLKNDDALVGRQQKHAGPVHALDFNHFQQNLFASGAGDSEIFIWDLNNTSTPMSPGTKSQPLEDVLSVAWNKQVQHILASSFASKCVIWDLRKNEPIIKLTDTVSRIRWKTVAWHPDVATQLCLASEEDHSPVIQMWDLRFATSPLKTLENHQRGVLALAWCTQDADLLVSCGKDDRILCWNPNSNHQTGEVLSEIAKTNQWSFDVVWCPRNPALIACPNYDGHVAVYSLMGGKTQQIQTSNKIMDSFPGMDGFAQAPQPQQAHVSVSVDPSKAPKWLRKPVGASFGFGGHLISFDNDAPVKKVQVSQVITEGEFVQKSAELEQALESGNFVEYCLNKSNETDDQHKKYIWHFLKANFENNPRAELLNLLGYRIEDINSKLSQHIGKPVLKQEDFASNRIEDYDSSDPFSDISQHNGLGAPFKIKTTDDTDGLITQALLLNNVEAAVELCLKNERYADALIIATTGGPDLLAKTQHQYLDKSEGYVSNLISAMISEDWASIINNCDISSWKEALAGALTHASDQDLPVLCEQLGVRLESSTHINPKFAQDAQLCYICSGNFDRLVQSWSDNLSSTSDLQELVELTSFLRKSIERQGRNVPISGSLAELLARYAGILAGQGSLQTALNYLAAAQTDKVVSLRERLMTTLGQNRRSSARTSMSSTNPFHPTQFTPATPAFNTGLPTATNQAWQSNQWNAPPKPATPGPPPIQHPPRPDSVGSGRGGLSRKHVRDPSVSNNQYPAAYAPAPAQSYDNFYNPPQIGQAAPQMFQPQPVQNSMAMPQPLEHAQPAFNYQAHAAPGWNDPPALNRPPKAQPKPLEPQNDPITHPIFGQAPSQPANGYYNEPQNTFQPPPMQSYGAPPQGPGAFAPANAPYEPPVQQYNPGNFNQNAIGLGNVSNQAPAQPVKPETPQTVQKPAVPSEHEIMQRVFDELKERCGCATNNPQTRRKLEDVGKRLETLYDCLRYNKLSPNALSSLHQIVQFVQSGDYTNGLHLLTQLVQGPDFSQICNFMPGIKVLIQLALQLQVYLS